jgi:hypothetical protein
MVMEDVLDEMDWLEMEEVGFGLNGMTWNRGSQVWPAWLNLDWQTSALAQLQ